MKHSILIPLLPVLCILQTASAQLSFEGTYNGMVNRNDNYATITTSDGGYLLCGTYDSYQPDEDVHIIKLDGSGNVQFSFRYGGFSRDIASSVVQTTDGGYLIAGNTSSYAPGGSIYDAWMIKTDASGTLSWCRTHGDNSEEGFDAVVQCSDGGFALAGYTYSYSGDRDCWIVKTDTDGSMQWSKAISLGTGEDRFTHLQQTADGGYIACGFTQNISGSTNDFYAARFNSSGTLTWNRVYRTSGESAAFAASETAGNGFVFAGGGPAFGSGDAYLVKTDAGGNIQWDRSYGGSSADHSFSVQQTCDGGYILGGQSFSFGNALQMYIVKADSTGSMQWSKDYGNTDWDYGRNIMVTGDGGYAMGGFRIVLMANTSRMYLVKTEASGLTTCSAAYNNGTSGSPGFSDTIPSPLVTDTMAVSALQSIFVNPVFVPPAVTCLAGSTASISGDTLLCPGESTTLTASGLTAYLWSTGDTTAAISVTPAATTTYYLYNGCTTADSIMVTVYPPASVSGLTPDTTILKYDSVGLSVSGSGSFAWSPATGLSCTACPDPMASPLSTTTYYVTYTGPDGCTATDSVTVTVTDPACNAWIPNAFSPNRDGYNDEFRVLGNCISTVQLSVYNRWGVKVFEMNGAPSPGWDGTYKGKACEMDVFVYYGNATLLDNTVVTLKGDVTLVR